VHYTRSQLAQHGLVIAAYSATRGDYVKAHGSDTYGRLVGFSCGGSVVVAWERDNFAAKCRALDAAREREGRRIDARAEALKQRIGRLGGVR